MYCRFCGSEILEDSTFCTNCGKKVLRKEDFPLRFIEDNYELFVYVLSCFFPFSKEQLEKYQDKLFWGFIEFRENLVEYVHSYFNSEGVSYCPIRLIYGVSTNQNINCTTEMFEKFRQFDNTIFMFGEDSILKVIISEFANKEGFINWEDLFLNENFIWDKDFINKYLDYFEGYNLIDVNNVDMEYLLDNLDKEEISHSSNRINIKDNLSIIEKFEDYWDWYRLSGNDNIYWTPEYLEKYESRIDWNRIQENPNIHWTLNSIIQFKDKIRVYSEGGYMDVAFDTDGSMYPVTDEYDFGIDRFVDNEIAMILLKELFEPQLFLDKYSCYEFIKKNLCGFSRNQKINWSLELLQKYKDIWDWDFLSKNESIVFNEEIIEIFESKWDWSELCCNRGVKWDLNLIEKYKDGTKSHIKLNNRHYEFLIFGTRYEQNMFDDYLTIYGLDSNPSVKFDELLVIKYFDKWNWYYLLNNESVQWTKNLLLRVINTTELYYGLEFDEESMDYNPQMKLQYAKFGYNCIKSQWELIFKDYVDVYGIDKLLNLKKMI
jgi:hypothetical protein